MATKKMTDNSRPCVCSLCKAQARSIPGTKHRRCGSSVNAKPKAKHGIHGGVRGVWG